MRSHTNDSTGARLQDASKFSRDTRLLSEPIHGLFSLLDLMLMIVSFLRTRAVYTTHQRIYSRFVLRRGYAVATDAPPVTGTNRACSCTIQLRYFMSILTDVQRRGSYSEEILEDC